MNFTKMATSRVLKLWLGFTYANKSALTNQTTSTDSFSEVFQVTMYRMSEE